MSIYAEQTVTDMQRAELTREREHRVYLARLRLWAQRFRSLLAA